MNLRSNLLPAVCVFICLTNLAVGAEIEVNSKGPWGTYSLRQAIADAADGDTITFSPGFDGGTIALGGSELVVDKDLLIDASALPNGITISGVSQSRVFQVAVGASVTMIGLTISDGRILDAGGSTGTHLERINRVSGGGILVLGDLTLRACRITGNESAVNPTTYTVGSGGGVAVMEDARLTIEDSEITNNATVGSDLGGHGGGIYMRDGILDIRNSTISGNTTSTALYGGYGGGISTSGGSVTIRDSLITNNRTGDSTEVWEFLDQIEGGPGGNGGGCSHSQTEVLIERSIISHNETGNGGSGTGNRRPVPGGNGGRGGGIYVWRGATTINSSTVAHNRTGMGGVGDGSVGSGGSGAGLHLRGPTTINNSTVAHNHTGTGDVSEPGQGGSGGGIVVWSRDEAVVINNSTIYGNRAADGGAGGGIYLRQSPSLTLTHVTVTDNLATREASNPGGGIFILGEGELELRHSIIAGNHSPNVLDIHGTYSETGANFIGGDPMLVQLGNFGGATQTILPFPGSPVIDAGGASVLTEDQRGLPRVGAPDLGAVEVQGESDLFRFRLPLISQVRVTDGGIELSTWLVGRTVGVEHSPDLSPGSWVELGNFSAEEGATTAEFVDSDNTRLNAPSGFYRAFFRQ